MGEDRAGGIVRAHGEHRTHVRTPRAIEIFERDPPGAVIVEPVRDGSNAVERIKLMKLLWDALGTEFGGRHELYERNYAGASETIRVQTLQLALASGQAEQFKGFAEQCMAEYDLDGWTVPDLINPDDINVIKKRR